MTSRLFRGYVQTCFGKGILELHTAELPEVLTGVPPTELLMMFCPGAKMSTAGPKLENEARASEIAVAPTVIAEGARAGEVVPASVLVFPAAIAICTPLVVSCCNFVKFQSNFVAILCTY